MGQVSGLQRLLASSLTSFGEVSRSSGGVGRARREPRQGDLWRRLGHLLWSAVETQHLPAGEVGSSSGWLENVAGAPLRVFMRIGSGDGVPGQRQLLRELCFWIDGPSGRASATSGETAVIPVLLSPTPSVYKKDSPSRCRSGTARVCADIYRYAFGLGAERVLSHGRLA